MARIPTRVNLGSRGIILDSTLCPTCLEAPETVEHVFARCKEIVGILSLIVRWWDVVTPSCTVWLQNPTFACIM